MTTRLLQDERKRREKRSWEGRHVEPERMEQRLKEHASQQLVLVRAQYAVPGEVAFSFLHTERTVVFQIETIKFKDKLLCVSFSCMFSFDQDMRVDETLI